MKNTFHLRSYEPYGKKRLQRYTASSFPNRIIDFLILFLLTGTPAGCIKSLQWDSHKMSANSHFFFLLLRFCIIALLTWSSPCITYRIFLSFIFWYRQYNYPYKKNVYAKRGLFISFDGISTSETTNHFDLVLMRNPITIRN